MAAGKRKMLRECSGLLESKNDQTAQQLPERKEKLIRHGNYSKARVITGYDSCQKVKLARGHDSC